MIPDEIVSELNNAVESAMGGYKNFEITLVFRNKKPVYIETTHSVSTPKRNISRGIPVDLIHLTDGEGEA